MKKIFGLFVVFCLVAGNAFGYSTTETIWNNVFDSTNSAIKTTITGNADITTVNNSQSNQDFTVKTLNSATAFVVNSDATASNEYVATSLPFHGDVISVAKQHDEIGILLDILTAPKAIVGFTGTGATTTTEAGYESGAGRTWTYSGGLAADKIFKGSTYVYSFDGVDSYLSTPDTADMSFGNGSNDSAFSIGGWVQVLTASSDAGAIMSKWDFATGAELREYKTELNSSKFKITQYDESANVQCSRITDAALAVGWHHVVVTQSGTGGATAAATIIIYVDGVAVASTATENASYVAMENLATTPLIGALLYDAGSRVSFFAGDMGRLFVTGEALSAANVYRLYEKSRGYYNQ